MSAIAFDTHRIVKRLQEVGFSDRQAEAVTDVLSESRGPTLDVATLATKTDLAQFATKADLAQFAIKADLAQFATKADLAQFATKADLAQFATKADSAQFATKADLATTKSELQTAIAETKADLLKWVIGTIGFQTVLILGAVVALARAL